MPFLNISIRCFLAFFVFSCGYVNAQSHDARPWQRLQSPKLAEVREHWSTPPPEYGPEPYYGLNGPITIDVVRRDLDTMKSLGFRAVTAQYGFGSERAYLSPSYLDFFRQFVLEAKKRGMRVWIVDDAGYPSGFAGGKFTAEHPELRMQALIVASQTSLKSGEIFGQIIPADTVAVTAISSAGQQYPFRLAMAVRTGSRRMDGGQCWWSSMLFAPRLRVLIQILSASRMARSLLKII